MIETTHFRAEDYLDTPEAVEEYAAEMTGTLDRPMRPEEVDWMARFRSDIRRQQAKAAQRQFDRRAAKNTRAES